MRIDGIAVSYGENIALKEVSLHVDKGEIVTIIGSNGAGKSTTLKAISGIVKLSRGRIEYKGKPINRLAPAQIVRAGISHCPEGRQLWPDMTVLENLEMGGYICKSRQDLEKLMQDIMDVFPILRERKNQLAGSLSGGEQQALAVGRSLMSDPELILFDEPSLGLAPMLVESILKTIQHLRDRGKTIVLVEQNANAALRIADRGYVLEKGEVSLEGKSTDLSNNARIKEIYLGL